MKVGTLRDVFRAAYLGTHTLTASAADVAGWTSETSVSFQLVATLGSLPEERSARSAPVGTSTRTGS